ncbi:LYR motif-containing protein 4-like [Bolinopsis microptera]|uniref:LYR motif-containing protein 4-like n=1 Tax=Bolinopsis microptera TaxID=2820187 RepID=UPI00307A440E
MGEVRAMYRVMMRTAQQFSDSAYRNYALRRIRHEFRTCQEFDSKRATDNLNMLVRQITISKLYSMPVDVLHKKT